MNAYQKGDLVRCSGAFTNAAGTPTDPTVVKFSFRTPTGLVTTYIYGIDVQLAKDSAGNYHVDVDCSMGGVFYYRFFSTGTGQAADESQFFVSESKF